MRARRGKRGKGVRKSGSQSQPIFSKFCRWEWGSKIFKAISEFLLCKSGPYQSCRSANRGLMRVVALQIRVISELPLCKSGPYQSCCSANKGHIRIVALKIRAIAELLLCKSGPYQSCCSANQGHIRVVALQIRAMISELFFCISGPHQSSCSANQWLIFGNQEWKCDETKQPQEKPDGF